MIRFSAQIQTQLFQALKTSFPDAKISTTDIEALAICLSSGQNFGDGEIPDELRKIDLSSYAPALSERAKSVPMLQAYTVERKKADKFRYYWATAVHTRVTPSGFSPFTGELAMARVSLDANRPKTYRTAFGTIAPGDHLIDTVFEANQKYQGTLGYELKRLDLITPPRDVLRFGAISVFLGYKKKSDKAPSCYILEAGTATGQPKVLYLGLGPGQSINAYSGYKPTPFSCPDHAYLGTFTVKSGDEPDRLHITSRDVNGGVSQTPYIDVDIQWTLQTGPLRNIWPGFLIARAAGIVLARSLTKKISTDCGTGPTPGSGAS